MTPVRTFAGGPYELSKGLGHMSDDEPFRPQRHNLSATDLPGFSGLDEKYVSAALCLADDHHVETGKRRMLAAGLASVPWQETPHVAEHFAWLIEREPDALTACSLFFGVIAAHPSAWTIWEWKHHVLRTTQLPLLRTAIMGNLIGEAEFDFDSDEGISLLALMDPADAEQRTFLIEHQWLAGEPNRDVAEIVAMLSPNASMAEKSVAIRIMRFSDDPRLGERAMPALRELFRNEGHAGLSLRIADVLVWKSNFRIDLDLVAFVIETFHRSGVVAAEVALASMLYGVEGFLMDSFAAVEERSNTLTRAVLDSFTASDHVDASDVLEVLSALSIDATNVQAAFAATAALEELHQPNAGGAQLVFDTARQGADPTARALAIRVLAKKPRALRSLCDELKGLTVGVATDPAVRRSAFHALLDHNAGLGISVKQVIDLYFHYLCDAPFVHFGDAVSPSDAANVPAHYINRFTESFDDIASQEAREAAFRLVADTFSFGIQEEFVAHWGAIVALMLRAFEKPRHGQLHYFIFWNMLHDVDIPEPHGAAFRAGLRDQLTQVKYTKATRSLIENWLKESQN
jgi:hypothetical protein